MHVDARELEDGTVIRGDVCIVGAGAAGISMVLDWIDSGHDVVLLEGGGFDYDAQVQDLYAGETSGQRYYPLMASRLHMFGGTTGHWGGMCAPFDPIDFEVRDWVPLSGWPIGLEELAPYYRRAQPRVEIGDHPFELDYWLARDRKLKPFALDPAIVRHKIWQFSPFSRFGTLYRDPLVQARNVRLYTYANVVEITPSDDLRSVRSLTVRNHAGRNLTVEARCVILACGAIQNARLLLASDERARGGLGNARDQVGRYFMEHLEISTGELWLAGPHPMRLYEWKDTDTLARSELGISEPVQRAQRILNGTVSLRALAVGRKLTPRMDLWQNEDPRQSLDRFLQDMVNADSLARTEDDDRLDRAFELDLRMEQAPNPRSRVTLDPEVDDLGMRRAHLHWDLTELDKRSVRTTMVLLATEFGRADLGRIRLHEWLRDETDPTFPPDTNGGWHHMGTTRMGTDPATSVVDADCRVHGIDNLFVAGSSCFATSAAPNPTLTVIALSLRTSDHVRGLLGG
jgi:choline dehydrogenase-like flavoprotein